MLKAYKAQASRLGAWLEKRGLPISRSDSLEAVAIAQGMRNWNMLAAHARQSETPPTPLQEFVLKNYRQGRAGNCQNEDDVTRTGDQLALFAYKTAGLTGAYSERFAAELRQAADELHRLSNLVTKTLENVESSRYPEARKAVLGTPMSLIDMRRKAADKAFENYDLGDMQVEDSDGWSYADNWATKTFYYMLPDMDPNDPTRKAEFSVEFARNTAEIVDLSVSG